MSFKSIAKNVRKPEYEIAPLFYTRWSPRAMSGEEMTKEELFPLFEAAKWAPSSYNNQPWRFIVALSKEEKERFMDFLVDFNKQWCTNASALVVILSSKVFEFNGQPSQTHSFDTGAAWGSLCLEGARRGLVVHGMQGFDYDKVKKVLNIGENYVVEAMCAIGKIGKKSALSKEMREKEIPSQRKSVHDIVSFGTFNWK